MNLLDLMGDPKPAPPSQPIPTSAPNPKPAAPPQPKPESTRGYTPRPVRPMWRDGRPVPGSNGGFVHHQIGDLRWLIHRYENGQPLGRWHRWQDTAHGLMWVCIDPADATGINAQPDTPPKGGAGA